MDSNGKQQVANSNQRMWQQQQQLGLDEALLVVNKSSVASELDVFYQLDDCFGCPLELLKRLQDKRNRFEELVVGTRFKFQLELRDSANHRVLCHYDHLELNNHAHYTLQAATCSLETLDAGECRLCPPLILLSLLLLLHLTHWLYGKLVSASRQKQAAAAAAAESSAASSSDSDNQQIQAAAAEEQAGNKSGKSARILSLDAFRGLTIAGMIVVNLGGAGYALLDHAPWDGLTPADLVFPFFIFAMGASLAPSARSMADGAKLANDERQDFKRAFQRILRRSSILMALGLCLNSRWLNGRSLHHLRLTGVLQRFSLSYLTVASVYLAELALNRWIKRQSLYRVPCLARLASLLCELLAGALLLALYLYSSLYLDYGSHLGCPPGYLGPGGQTEAGIYANCTGGAAAWLDRLVLGPSHLYQDRQLQALFKTQTTHDPEGLLGLTTSCLLTLIGLQCGKMLLANRKPTAKRRLAGFAQWTVLLGALACLAANWIPVNKRLWSLSFVLASGALAYLTLGALYLLLDLHKVGLEQSCLLVRLLVSAGKNPLLLYVGHSLLDNLLPWHFAVNQSSHLQLLLRLAWSTLVWLLLAHYLARRRLFIRL